MRVLSASGRMRPVLSLFPGSGVHRPCPSALCRAPKSRSSPLNCCFCAAWASTADRHPGRWRSTDKASSLTHRSRPRNRPRVAGDRPRAAAKEQPAIPLRVETGKPFSATTLPPPSDVVAGPARSPSGRAFSCERPERTPRRARRPPVPSDSGQNLSRRDEGTTGTIRLSGGSKSSCSAQSRRTQRASARRQRTRQRHFDQPSGVAGLHGPDRRRAPGQPRVDPGRSSAARGFDRRAAADQGEPTAGGLGAVA